MNKIEVDNWKDSCVFCKHFTSYQDECEVELEPPDYGRCYHDKNTDVDECFGDGMRCEFFERVGNAR